MATKNELKKSINEIIEKHREMLTKAFLKANNLPVDGNYTLSISTIWAYSLCLTKEGETGEHSASECYQTLQGLYYFVKDACALLYNNLPKN